MSVTVLETLQNAEINIENSLLIGRSVLRIAQSQLHNAIVLLEKGWDVDTLVEPLLERYGTVEDVPGYHVGGGQDNGE